MSEFIPRWSHQTQATRQERSQGRANQRTGKTDRTGPNRNNFYVERQAAGGTGGTAVSNLAGQATGKTSDTPSDVPSVPEVGDMPLHEFAEAGLVLSVWSDVVETEIIFVSDDVPNSALEGRRGVAYRASELSHLSQLDLDRETLAFVHGIKNIFGGVVTSAGRKTGR